MRIALALFVAAVAACSSTTTGTGTGTSSSSSSSSGGGSSGASGGACASRTGSYAYGETLRSGTCGDALSAAFTPESCTQPFCIPFASLFESGGETDPSSIFTNCTGTIVTTADNCTVQFSFECAPGDGSSVNNVGSVTWNADGTAASGSKTVTGYQDGDVVCTGSYGIEISQ